MYKMMIMLQNDEMIAQFAMMGGESGSGGNTGGSRVSRAGGLTLHRSNSSLELPHSPERTGSTIDAQPLRREYGSHGKPKFFASIFCFQNDKNKKKNDLCVK